MPFGIGRGNLNRDNKKKQSQMNDPASVFDQVLVTVQQHRICVVIGLLMCKKHTSQTSSK
jgi:hypothetical protein